MRPGKARVKRVEITRRNDNDTARVEITMAKRERRAGIGQVLDHVEHHNDVHHPELGEVAFIGNSGGYVQSALAAGAARSVGNFDASHIVESRGFLKEKAVGAADLEETPARVVWPDEFEQMRKFTAQYRFGALIVNIAVGAPTGEIIAAVIFPRIKLVALRSPEPAHGTFYNSAIVLLIQNPMQRRSLAGGTIELHADTLLHSANLA
jgi:hypothetical protein